MVSGSWQKIGTVLYSGDREVSHQCIHAYSPAHRKSRKYKPDAWLYRRISQPIIENSLDMTGQWHLELPVTERIHISSHKAIFHYTLVFISVRKDRNLTLTSAALVSKLMCRTKIPM
jgi:hypothetical protein